MSLTQLLVPTYIQFLKSLADWLKKSRTQLPMTEAEELLSARLAPDMFPLATQIRFACVQVQEAVLRLKGDALSEAIDELLSEGRNADRYPGTLSDALARIDDTVALLEELAPNALDADSVEVITLKLPDGLIFDLTAEQYARDWALPQFYFHLMTAYAILRSKNVELGKVDYVPHMIAYLRSDSSPEG